MIPKIIHYCWLSGDPIPADLQRCMNTWKRRLPDYEMMLWDTNRFPLDQSKWVKEAFENKKYAFAADYIRAYALYHYGGIYLDMDVEVLKSFDPLLSLPMFIGYDHHTDKYMEVATWGVSKGNEILKILLDCYNEKTFVKEDGTLDTEVMPQFASRVLQVSGFKFIAVKTKNEAADVFAKGEREIPIFPRHWFCPLDWYTYKLNKTKETFSIHHYKGSWLPDEVRKERAVLSKLGHYIPLIWRKIQALLKLQ